MTTRLACVAALVAALVGAAATAADAPLVAGKTIPLKGAAGKLDHLAVDVAGGRLFVANKPNNTLDVVDLKTGTLARQVAGQGKVSGVAYAADLDMVYVGNGAGVCNGFDAKDFKQVFSAKAPGADNVHYHPGAKAVYVCHGATLTVLDAKTGAERAAVKLPGAGHGFVLDEAAGRGYVVVTKPSAVAVVDLTTHTVVGNFPMAHADGGSPIAHDAKAGRLFVGCPKKPAGVAVLDAKTGREVATVGIPAGVDDVQFDASRGRLYASCGDGALVVIEAAGDGYAVAAKLDTPKNARTCVFGGDKLYLGVPAADAGGAAEVRVFDARPAAPAKR